MTDRRYTYPCTPECRPGRCVGHPRNVELVPDPLARPCALCGEPEHPGTRDEPTPYCAACERSFTAAIRRGIGAL